MSTGVGVSVGTGVGVGVGIGIIGDFAGFEPTNKLCGQQDDRQDDPWVQRFGHEGQNGRAQRNGQYDAVKGRQVLCFCHSDDAEGYLDDRYEAGKCIKEGYQQVEYERGIDER